MTELNPWREALIAALKERELQVHENRQTPTDLLEILIDHVALNASDNKAKKRLAHMAGIADQLIATGLAINANLHPDQRTAVAIPRDETGAPMNARMDEETIKVIEAWARGCKVQCRYRSAGDEWREVALHDGDPCIPNFLHPMLEFRVRPGNHLVTINDGPTIFYQPPAPLDWDEAPV